MKWVTMWGNAQSTVTPEPAFYAKDITLRYPVFIPFSGKMLRIHLDNFCCNEDVTISAICVSVGDTLSDEQKEVTYLTYQGRREMVIPAHQSIVTDEITYDMEENKYLIVSIYLREYTKLTSGVDIIGPLSKGYFAYGNHLESRKLNVNLSKSTSWVYFLADIDIYTEDENYAVICYGDSITSQDWPDDMLLALREKNINNISVVRKAVSGTRILKQYECITYQSYGKSGKNRFLHEIESVSGAKKLIIQHGINDIIHPVGEEINMFRPMSDMPTALELIEGLSYYIEEATNLGLETYLGTLLPIYGWRSYADFREQIKNEVNQWILSQSSIDFAKEVGESKGDYYSFKDGCDSGDHLHPSKSAYKKMGILAAKKILK